MAGFRSQPTLTPLAKDTLAALLLSSHSISCNRDSRGGRMTNKADRILLYGQIKINATYNIIMIDGGHK